jgi:ubiquinone/menaquinone biosynthesis C-methylase UbiE
MTIQARPHKWIGMEGAIAGLYAKITRKDMPEYKAVARRIAANLSDGAVVLEVAPGPGYFAIELAGLGSYEVTGLDISTSFVRIARDNAITAQVSVDFQHGNAAAMPFEADRFDLVFCRAAFKNFAEPLAALAEMRRVLKPDGRVVIIDMRSDTGNAEIDRHVDKMQLHTVTRLLTKGILRWLRNRAYSEADFRRFITASSFHLSGIEPSRTGLEITLVK